MTAPVTVGVSLKTYFGNARARAWFAEVAPRLQAHPAIADGRVRFFVIPTYLQIPAAIEAFAESPVLVGAQDVSAHPPGAFTGEITAAELAEVGVQVAEIGHAERRRLFGETDEVTASKAAASLEHGITPVLCIGEDVRMSGADAASSPDAALHTYHSAQREKAARCIQGFLQRQQLQQGGAGAGADEHQMAPESPPLYSEDQLKCFRRAQSAFSSHVRQQEADAQELHMTMLMGGDVAQLIR